MPEMYGTWTISYQDQTYYERTLDWEPECDIEEKSFRIGIDDPRELPFAEFLCSFRKTENGYVSSIMIIRIDREIYDSDMINRLVAAIPAATQDMYGLKADCISIDLIRIGEIGSREPRPDKETVIRQIREACDENCLRFIEETERSENGK